MVVSSGGKECYVTPYKVCNSVTVTIYHSEAKKSLLLMNPRWEIQGR
jgi:hypothetical protein